MNLGRDSSLIRGGDVQRGMKMKKISRSIKEESSEDSSENSNKKNEKKSSE